MVTEILTAARAVEPWSLDLLERLVAEPSVTGQSSKIDEILAEELAGLGLDVETIPCDPVPWASDPEFSPPVCLEDGAPATVVATLGQARRNPRLLLFAHTDTEPVSEGWRTQPFELRRQGGRLFGLGVADDLSGVVNILASIRLLLKLDAPRAFDPVIVLGPGKQGGALGTLPGVASAAHLDRAIYVHPPETRRGLSELKCASRGVATFTMNVPGRTPAPVEERTPVSADPKSGINAAVRAARLVARLESDPPGGGTWAVTGVRACSAPYEVPGQASVEVAVWFRGGTVDDRGADLTGWLAREAADGFETTHPVGFELTGLRANPAACTDDDWIDLVASTVADVAGYRPHRYDGHAASDIRFPLRRHGVPTIGLGCLAGNFYGCDEWIDERSWHLTTVAVAAILAGRDGR